MRLTRVIINCVVLALFVAGIGICQSAAESAAPSCSTGTQSSCGPWSGGDVFVAVGNGQTQVYHNFPSEGGSPNYQKIHTLNDDLGGGYTAGCSFDSHGNLYATNFTQSTVVEFDVNSPHDILQTILTGGSSASLHNESVVFDAAGNFYVGHADSVSNENFVEGGGKVEKYGPDNSQLPPLSGYAVAPDQRGSDWVELASDGRTLFYTSEGSLIKRFDVFTNTQLADFATLPSGGKAFALRLLPPFDGTGGLLVANTANILRLNGSGTVTKTYTAPGEAKWFALNLDSNGTSFWAGDAISGHVYRFNISSGAVEATVDTGVPLGTSTQVGGICVVGQPGPVSTIPVTYLPGSNVEGHATFNSGDPKKAGFWQATDDVILPPGFTLGVSRVQTSCSSLKPRLTKYFSTDPRLPIPIPAVDGSCYFYHITAPTDVDSLHTGGIHLNTGYVDPLLAVLPPSFQPSPFGLCDVLRAAPRYLDAPSAPLVGIPNFDFTYDATNLYNPFGKFPDPTLPGGPTPKHNDYVAVCRFPTGSATLNPPPFSTFHIGATITFTARVRKNNGSNVTDAATAPNYMPLSIANLTSPPATLVQALGVSDCSYVGQTTPPCTATPFFVFQSETGNYTGPVTVTSPPFVPGTTYSACIDSFRSPTAYTPEPTQPPPYFARRCTAFKVVQ